MEQYNFRNLTGMTFGRLTVIERGPDRVAPSGQKKTMWLCKCSCGNPNLVNIESYSLTHGHTISCGCFHKEVTSKVHKKFNRYEMTDECCVGYTTDGFPFYIDKEDLFNVRQYCWYQRHGYILSGSGKNKLFLHRFVMGLEKVNGLYVDHMNHDPFDNRRSNLRIVTHAENMRNLKVNSKNTSGVTGVYLNKRTGNWYSQIVVNRKTHCLGTYASFDDAVAARKAAEERYFGEYSYDNSIAAVPRIAV